MAVDERRRLQLADAVKRALGDDEGVTLMELLPPVGWADVATKQDLSSEVGMVRRDLEAFRADVDRQFAEVTRQFGEIDRHFDAFEERLTDKFDARFERGFRRVIVTMSSLLVGGFFAVVLATVVR